MRNKLIWDPNDNKKVLSDPPALPANSVEVLLPPKYIFAISKKFELRVALDCDRQQDNSVKHETLFHNEPVLAAGELTFRSGKVNTICDRSGSYCTIGALQTDPSFVRSLLRTFQSEFIPVETALINSLKDLLEENDND